MTIYFLFLYSHNNSFAKQYTRNKKMRHLTFVCELASCNKKVYNAHFYDTEIPHNKNSIKMWALTWNDNSR